MVRQVATFPVKSTLPIYNKKYKQQPCRHIMSLDQIKTGFPFWMTISLVFIAIVSMTAIIYTQSLGLNYAFVGIIWISASVMLPCFIGFFIYDNIRTFSPSIFGMIVAAIIVCIIDSAFIFVNTCDNNALVCSNKLNVFVPVIMSMLIVIILSTLVIMIKDWMSRNNKNAG